MLTELLRKPTMWILALISEHSCLSFSQKLMAMYSELSLHAHSTQGSTRCYPFNNYLLDTYSLTSMVIDTRIGTMVNKTDTALVLKKEENMQNKTKQKIRKQKKKWL